MSASQSRTASPPGTVTTDPEAFPAPRPAEPSELPTSELVQRLTEQARTLITDEVALAKAEMTTKAKALGVGAGLAGAGGMLALAGGLALIAAAIAALALVLPVWLAALIVGVVLLAIGGGLALVGKNRIQAGSPPVPKQAIDSTRQDVEAVKSGVQHR
jgi:hypothetical protein